MDGSVICVVQIIFESINNRESLYYNTSSVFLLEYIFIFNKIHLKNKLLLYLHKKYVFLLLWLSHQYTKG